MYMALWPSCGADLLHCRRQWTPLYVSLIEFFNKNHYFFLLCLHLLNNKMSHSDFLIEPYWAQTQNTTGSQH